MFEVGVGADVGSLVVVVVVVVVVGVVTAGTGEVFCPAKALTWLVSICMSWKYGDKYK